MICSASCFAFEMHLCSSIFRMKYITCNPCMKDLVVWLESLRASSGCRETPGKKMGLRIRFPELSNVILSVETLSSFSTKSTRGLLDADNACVAFIRLSSSTCNVAFFPSTAKSIVRLDETLSSSLSDKLRSGFRVKCVSFKPSPSLLAPSLPEMTSSPPWSPASKVSVVPAWFE